MGTLLLASVLGWSEVVGYLMGSACPEPLAAGSVSAGAMVAVVASTPVGAALSVVAVVVLAAPSTALDAAAVDGRRPCPHRTTTAIWRPRCACSTLYAVCVCECSI